MTRDNGQRGQPTRLRRWLLLYRPTRTDAWRNRALFYLLVLAIPCWSLLAAGGYVAPDQDRALVGITIISPLICFAILAHKAALRADATLANVGAPQSGRRLFDTWPFPVQEPPKQQVTWGYLYSIAGPFLMVVGRWLSAAPTFLPLWLLFESIASEQGEELPATLLCRYLLSLLPAGLLVLIYLAGSALSFVIGFFLLGAGRRFHYLGPRLRVADARFLLQQSGERPVLLLRSFADEELRDLSPLRPFELRYEERISTALKRLGPVITVGRPGDTFGFAGAARLYVSYDHWRSAVRHLLT